jgi:hypothetical protein
VWPFFLAFDGGLPSVKKSRELTDNSGITAHLAALRYVCCWAFLPATLPASFLPLGAGFFMLLRPIISDSITRI